MATFDAVVPAGGAARRMGGADKPGLDVAGRTLLDRVLAALAGADRRVVVGPLRAGRPGVWQTRERPAGGGPVAALAAGLALVRAAVVVVLAGDLASVDRATVTRLRDRLADGGCDGVVLVDAEGRPQWLAGAWRTRALSAAVPAEPAGLSMGALAGRLAVARLPAPGPWWDCNTPEDLEAAREQAG